MDAAAEPTWTYLRRFPEETANSSDTLLRRCIIAKSQALYQFQYLCGMVLGVYIVQRILNYALFV